MYQKGFVRKQLMRISAIEANALKTMHDLHVWSVISENVVTFKGIAVSFNFPGHVTQACHGNQPFPFRVIVSYHSHQWEGKASHSYSKEKEGDFVQSWLWMALLFSFWHQALADKKKKEERLRKNPPPLPKKLRLVLRAHGIYGDVKPIRYKRKHVEKHSCYIYCHFRANEENLTFPKDDFYFKWEFCYERMEFEKALERVRMHYHPSLLNRPNDLLQAKVELNMHHKGDKYIDEFSKIVPIIHPFDDKMRAKSLCVFAEYVRGHNWSPQASWTVKHLFQHGRKPTRSPGSWSCGLWRLGSYKWNCQGAFRHLRNR